MTPVHPRRRVDRRATLMAVVRPLVTAACAVTAYYLLPMTQKITAITVLILVGGLLGIALLLAWHIRAIVHSPRPRLRAMEAVGVVIPLFLVLFSTVYLLMSRAHAPAFSAPLSRTDALYFTVTVFSTVGFGDITARSEGARLVTIGQMTTDLVLIGAVARVLLGAVQRGVQRRAVIRPRRRVGSRAARWTVKRRTPERPNGVRRAGRGG